MRRVRAGAPREAVGEGRHRAREAAVQMLYLWEVGRVAPADLGTTWSRLTAGDTEALTPPLQTFAEGLAVGTAGLLDRIDPLIAEAAAHWRLERMNVVDRLVLRLGVYELLREPETPATVVIDEALELGRSFSGDASVPFINGVLDAIRRTLERA